LATLKRAIVSGALTPDTPIDKTDWCATFQASRLSITTAIDRLAFEGLVVVEP
jgi:DNA-binding GntR family transcriptional regulator